jgi:hypothetical protein
MKRQGSAIILLAADGKEEFKELIRYDLGAAELKMVRFCAYPGNTQEATDVRLIDLRVRADSMDADQRDEKSPIALATRPAFSRSWLVVVEVTGLAAVVSLAGLGAYLYLRRKKPAAPGTDGKSAPAAGSEAPAPLISFACPGCKKPIKAKKALAGKKVKCPLCDKPIHVPPAEAIQAGRSPK